MSFGASPAPEECQRR